MELHKVTLGKCTIVIIFIIPFVSPGRISLRNLRLKKGALDKFRFPVDVLEGRELNGIFTSSFVHALVQVILARSPYLCIG